MNDCSNRPYLSTNVTDAIKNFTSLRIIESLYDEINTVSKKILLLAQEDEMARLLMTVPGIEYYPVLCYVNYWRL
jgi:hypothetical protein